MKKVISIGNALVDILVKLPTEDVINNLNYPKGSMQLIEIDEINRITFSTFGMDKFVVHGGSASNTAVGLARLGTKVGFVGKIGKDETGESFKKCLIENNVEPHLYLSEDHPSGRCHVLISPDSERTMCTYLGASSQLTAADIDTNIFNGYDIVHIEGYLVQNYELIEQIGKTAKECGLKLSIDLASFNVIEEHFNFLKDFVGKYVDILFANEEESFAFTKTDAEHAVVELSKRVETVIVKVGARGSYSVSHQGPIVYVPANKVECVDSTGAGDLYAAGFLHAMANDYPIEKCAKIATLCAGSVIQALGAKIPEEKWDDILKQIS